MTSYTKIKKQAQPSNTGSNIKYQDQTSNTRIRILTAFIRTLVPSSEQVVQQEGHQEATLREPWESLDLTPHADDLTGEHPPDHPEYTPKTLAATHTPGRPFPLDPTLREVSRAQVYLAKYRVGAVFRKELEELKEEIL